MKKYVFTALVMFATTAVFAQVKPTAPPPATDTTVNKSPVTRSTAPPPPNTKTKKDWSKVKLDPRRPQDHFMVELGYDNWVGSTDSMNIKGFNHSENFYFMYAWPFKSDARMSVAAGLGLGSSNIYFANTVNIIDINNSNQTIGFSGIAGTNHFKVFKLTTTYLEAPVELRFALDPEHMDHSWKFAVGAKFGILLSAYTKGKTLVSSSGVVQGNYTEKQSSKEFFSGAEVTPTIRVSKGYIGFFAQIHATSLIKASAGPAVFPVSGGIVISGL